MKRRFLLVAMMVAAFPFDSQRGDTRSHEPRIGSTFRMNGMSLAAQDSVRIKLKRKQAFEGYYKGYFSPDGAMLALLYSDHIDMVEISTDRRLFRLQRPQSQFY